MILKFFILTLGGLVMLPLVTLGNQKMVMKIESIPKFPFYFNTPFKIKFVPNLPNGTISVNTDFDSLEIRITDKSGFEFEKLQILYKSETKVYHGDFFTILSWRRNPIKNYFELILLFPMIASNKTVEINEIAAENEAEYLEIKENNKLARLLYKSKITLSLFPKIELSLTPFHGELDEFMSGQTVTVKCQSSGFTLLSRPNIVNLNEFTVESELYSEMVNEINVKIKLTSSDHGKTLACQAGKLREKFTIKVIHDPSYVKIFPSFNSVIKINSSITCDPGNGYPTPNTSWTLVKGPSISPESYLIDKDNKNMMFTKGSLTDSEWIFNCSARNKLNNSDAVYHKSVKFMSEGDKITILDMDNIETMINIKISETKKYFDLQLNKIMNNFNNILKDNVKLNQSNKDLLKEITIIKNSMKNYSKETLDLRKDVKDEIDKINILSKKQETRNTNADMSVISDTTGTKLEFQKLKDDLIRQNDDISGLKLKTETIKMSIKFEKMLNNKVQQDIKSLVQSNLALQGQLTFAKSHLFWLAPIAWTVTGIDVDDLSGKKEASSDPFYTQINNYKLHLYSSYTATKIEFYIYLYDSLRNKHSRQPFKSQFTVTVVHKLLPNIKLDRKILTTINTTPGVSEAISFTRKELNRFGFLDDHIIKIVCDVQEI